MWKFPRIAALLVAVAVVVAAMVTYREYMLNTTDITQREAWPSDLVKLVAESNAGGDAIEDIDVRSVGFVSTYAWRMPASDDRVELHKRRFHLSQVPRRGVEHKRLLSQLPRAWEPTAAGYGRLVPAGSATAMVSIGQRSAISGASRYGQMSVLASLLNTTEQDELQIKIDIRSKNRFPVSIDTTARAPLGRWFLVGGADSRIGLPVHADDGKRSVAVMRIDDGVQLLD